MKNMIMDLDVINLHCDHVDNLYESKGKEIIHLILIPTWIGWNGWSSCCSKKILKKKDKVGDNLNEHLY